MNPEAFQAPEEFDKKSVYTRIEAVIENLREGIEKSGQEVSEEDEAFYQNVLDTADAVVREKNVVSREDFIESLKYRKSKGFITEEEMEFIVKESR